MERRTYQTEGGGRNQRLDEKSEGAIRGVARKIAANSFFTAPGGVVKARSATETSEAFWLDTGA
jgi:hypothetical protein